MTFGKYFKNCNNLIVLFPLNFYFFFFEFTKNFGIYTTKNIKLTGIK